MYIKKYYLLEILCTNSYMIQNNLLKIKNKLFYVYD